MLVKLPHRCTGEEIVRVFKATSAFQETFEKQWVSKEFVGEFQYEPCPVRRTIRSIGVWVRPSFLRKKWVLFGKKVWKPDPNTEFMLEPVVLACYHDEVELTIRHVYEINQGGIEYVATSPHSPQFEHIRPQFERILASFFAGLQPQHA